MFDMLMPDLEHLHLSTDEIKLRSVTTSNKSAALINIMLAVEPQPDQHQLLKKRINN